MTFSQWSLTDENGAPVAGQSAGTLGVANGGTGLTTVASGNLLLGAGTSPLSPLAGSSAGDVLTWNGSAWTAGAATTTPASILLNSQVSQGTAQPAYTAGTFNDITPTEIIDTGGNCSVSGTVITLAAGTYQFNAFLLLIATAGTWGAFLELYDNTNATRIQRGFGGNLSAGQRSTQPLSGMFTIGVSTDIKWRVYVDGNNTTNTGALNVAGENEVYGQLALVKFA